MPNRTLAAALLLALLAGCGGFSDSGLNPFGWFRRGERVETLVPAPESVVLDRRPLMDSVTGLAIDRTYDGAVIRATGTPPTQGWWNGELVEDTEVEPTEGVLAYVFRVAPPFRPARVSTPQSREIVVGLKLTRQDLDGVREIRVRGARNALAARR